MISKDNADFTQAHVRSETNKNKKICSKETEVLDCDLNDVSDGKIPESKESKAAMLSPNGLVRRLLCSVLLHGACDLSSQERSVVC